MQNNFPDFVNFYSTFYSPTKNEIKNLLTENGWKIRKESWGDFECSNEWSEFNLLGDENNPILKGTILNSETNYKILVQFLNTINARFQSELYDEDNFLLHQDSNIEN
jgi:hypothetical protein